MGDRDWRHAACSALGMALVSAVRARAHVDAAYSLQEMRTDDCHIRCQVCTQRVFRTAVSTLVAARGTLAKGSSGKNELLYKP